MHCLQVCLIVLSLEASAQNISSIRLGGTTSFTLSETMCLEGGHLYVEKTLPDHQLSTNNKESWLLKLNTDLLRVDSLNLMDYLHPSEKVIKVHDIISDDSGSIWVNLQADSLSPLNSSIYSRSVFLVIDSLLTSVEVWRIHHSIPARRSWGNSVTTFSLSNDSLLLIYQDASSNQMWPQAQIQLYHVPSKSMIYSSTAVLKGFVKPEFVKKKEGKCIIGGLTHPDWIGGTLALQLSSDGSQILDTVYFVNSLQSPTWIGYGQMISPTRDYSNSLAFIQNSFYQSGSFHDGQWYPSIQRRNLWGLSDVEFSQLSKPVSDTIMMLESVFGNSIKDEMFVMDTGGAFIMSLPDSYNRHYSYYLDTTSRIRIVYRHPNQGDIYDYSLRTNWSRVPNAVQLSDNHQVYLLTSEFNYPENPNPHRYSSLLSFPLSNPPIDLIEIDREQALPFTLYPNPAGERVFVQMEAPNEGSMRYSLQSTSGQLIQSEAYHPEEGIDLSTLASGVYHLMLWKNGQPIGTERLVVE